MDLTKMSAESLDRARRHSVTVTDEMVIDELARPLAAAEAESKEIKRLADPALAAIGFDYMLDAVRGGFDTWAAKPHNRRWAKRLEGTPAENDIAVCVALAVIEAVEPMLKVVERANDLPRLPRSRQAAQHPNGGRDE